jgi:hypothetical protein
VLSYFDTLRRNCNVDVLNFRTQFKISSFEMELCWNYEDTVLKIKPVRKTYSLNVIVG